MAKFLLPSAEDTKMSCFSDFNDHNPGKDVNILTRQMTPFLHLLFELCPSGPSKFNPTEFRPSFMF